MQIQETYKNITGYIVYCGFQCMPLYSALDWSAVTLLRLFVVAPEIQQVEDICVSMIGFIIALIMTALLALVAVVVAVSCWLIAYRRRPKVTGPLPHPPEFPNPLFTTPEPLAEPSPDYLSWSNTCHKYQIELAEDCRWKGVSFTDQTHGRSSL